MSRAATEIFIPNYAYPNGYNVWVTDGHCEAHFEQQVLLYYHSLCNGRRIDLKSTQQKAAGAIYSGGGRFTPIP